MGIADRSDAPSPPLSANRNIAFITDWSSSAPMMAWIWSRVKNRSPSSLRRLRFSLRFSAIRTRSNPSPMRMACPGSNRFSSAHVRIARM